MQAIIRPAAQVCLGPTGLRIGNHSAAFWAARAISSAKIGSSAVKPWVAEFMDAASFPSGVRGPELDLLFRLLARI